MTKRAVIVERPEHRERATRAVSSQPGRFILAIYNDTHCNHLLGLMAPQVVTETGGEYSANKAQAEWSWPAWLEYCQKVKDIAGAKPNTKVIGIGAGDLGELDLKARTIQLVSRNPTDILEIMRFTLAPLLSIVDRNYVIYGTEAHGGHSNWLEEQFAKSIGAEPIVMGEPIKVETPTGTKEMVKQQYARWDLIGEWGGVKVDVAHHMRIAGRPWTKGTPATTVCAESIIAYAEMGAKVPNLIIRAHAHDNYDSYDVSPICRVVTVLGWMIGQAHGVAVPYVKRVDPVTRPRPIGGLIVEIENGRYQVHKFRKEPPPLHMERW